MNIYLKKFNLLCEEILNQSTITVDTFDFKYQQQDNKLICQFDVSDDENILYNVTATINNDKDIIFDISSTDKNHKSEQLDEKSFMLRFYKDYTKFKKSYKQYKEEQQQTTETDKTTNKKYITVDGRNIPAVQLFNSKLKTNISDQINIKINNNTFIFRHIDDQTKNLIQINFDLVNDNIKKDQDIYRYNVICIVKLLHENSVPLKFIFIDPKTNDVVEEITKSDFASKYKSTYSNLLEAINQFEKTL